MIFPVQSTLYYYLSGSASILCSLRGMQSSGQVVTQERLVASRDCVQHDIEVGPFKNRMTRFDVREPGDFSISYEGHLGTFPEIITVNPLSKPEVYPDDPDILPFLFPSRYAPSDRFRNLAHDLFGKIEDPFAQAVAIEDWLFERLHYVYGISSEQTWAPDTFENRQGVCRDYAHLGIAFCRALFLPARYITAYCYQLEPQDFHAAFEVYLNGEWHLFDGTRMVPLNALAKIAIGRDASETPVAALSGEICSTGMEIYVYHEMVDGEDFSPVTRDDLREGNRSLVLR